VVLRRARVLRLMATGDTEAARISETALGGLFSEQVHERNRSIPDILNSDFVCIQFHPKVLERGEAQVLRIFRSQLVVAGSCTASLCSCGWQESPTE
jgi:hypothetical protein